MKCDVMIRSFCHEATEITSADKVELLAVGEGILSVGKGDTNYCYNLRDIMMYTVRNRVDENEDGLNAVG